jgi:cytochrome c oxidase assembly protein subunit 15
VTPQALEFDRQSAWPHRWAVALACATFPLIFLGGLVTTYDAGMAVPDWPNTYGYNLFLYPWQTWVHGPWGLFIEHGHRLLGSLVGMLAIALVVSAWWCQRTTWLRVLSLIALAGVIAQGLLGGMRVIADEVQLAKIHGCLGPAFFAYAAALATITSRRWRQSVAQPSRALSKLERLAIITTVLAYAQLVLGSQLRHLPLSASPGDFRTALVFHLATAVALLVHIGLLTASAWRDFRREPWLLRPAVGLLALIGLQLALGAATWVTKYGWPDMLAGYDFTADYVVLANSPQQAWITTAHVAVGSLILATSLLITVRSARLASRGSSLGATSRLAEVVQ